MRRSRIPWPLPAALAAYAAAAQAGTVYECRSAAGVAWQDRPCAASQRQAEVELAPPPAYAPSPVYGVAPATRAASRSERGASGRRAERTEARSWECRAANGEVFYRHGACPKSLPQEGTASARRGTAPPHVAVAATPLPRAEACRRMAAERGRSGRHRDERAPTYERNLGRDPCRRP